MNTTTTLPEKSTETAPIRVFVIDDHPLLREGLIKMLSMEPDLEICGELGSGRGAVDAILSISPDVLLLDLSLPDCSGLELIKDLRAAEFKGPILVISMHDETLYADRTLRAGANGYIMKEEATDRIILGIRTALEGNVFLSDEMQRRLLKRVAGFDQPKTDGICLERLSDREFEILELIGRGLPPRDIASMLSISPKTVDAHRARIKEKLGMRDGGELVRFAVRWVETGPGETKSRLRE